MWYKFGEVELIENLGGLSLPPSLTLASPMYSTSYWLLQCKDMSIIRQSVNNLENILSTHREINVYRYYI